MGELISLRNRSKLVQGRLFAIIDLLLEAKFITLYFIWCVGGMIFTENSQVFSFYFLFLTFNYFMLLLLHIP